MNLSLKISSKSGWVFSPRQDFLCFSLPFLAAFLFDGSNYFNQDWMGFFLTKVFFAGHIFTTHFPLTKSLVPAPVSKWKFFTIPLIYVGIYLTLMLIDFSYFQNFLCLSILLHIFYQHISWGKLSLGSSPYLLHYLRLLIAIPLTLWLFNQLPSAPHYLYHFTLTSHLPKLNWSNEYLLLSLTFFLFSLIGSISRKQGDFTLHLGRLHFFMTTTLWLIYGLFFAHTVSFFLYYLNISHGLGYMIYISRSWPHHQHLPTWNSSQRVYKVILVSLIGGGLWMTILWNSHKFLSPAFIFLAWLPLILHFAFDSFLWSKSRLSAVRF